jgi:addiction module HigA family antidote
MHNPPHPGGTLREDILPALNLSVTQAAQQLGVSRVQLFRVINERAAMPPELALRIEAWLTPAHGGRAELWLGQQARYDLWQAQQKPRPIIQPAIIPADQPG